LKAISPISPKYSGKVPPRFEKTEFLGAISQVEGDIVS
jgi:hypothetical protein